ncbi:a1-alpha2 repression [Rhizophlyctis rosea]|uniref:A1-alpha2 repression n=1 Tax=Rhizophlyctis rosea TaxID=64517 RepID=A0AAD5SKE2_9FUNG|nr:a1-alpha2 repression [Rhizophlyctis rosea]
MDQATANALFEQCAILLFLDAPPNMEFGIDFNTWTTGPRFRGLKFIPPGLHFVYHSSVSKFDQTGVRAGFFKVFEPREIVVKQWDPKREDIKPDNELDPDQVERYRLNIREFDQYLGYYPLIPTEEQPINTYRKWASLTTHITSTLLKRVLPQSWKISAMSSISKFSDVDVPKTFKSRGTGGAPTDMDVEGVTALTAVEAGTTKTSSAVEEDYRIHFTEMNLKRSFPDGASGVELTKYSLDKSHLLETLLQKKYKDYKEVLGELQLSFIIFLIGQVYDGLEQWKNLVQLICQSDEALDKYATTLYVEFLATLRYQIEECPDDFFHSEITGDNFLRYSLTFFVRTIQDRAGRGVPQALQKAVDGLLDYLRDRFQWDLRNDVRVIGEEEEEDDEYAPVVVETE